MRRLSRQASETRAEVAEVEQEQVEQAEKEAVVMNEQVAEVTEVTEVAPEVAEVAEVDITLSKRDNRVYVTENGVEMSRKEWVLNKFAANWKRGQIAKALGVPVQVIFGYTRDLTNAFHRPNVGAGRTAGVAINPLNGETATRSEVIKQLAASGKSRGEIVKMLGVSYQVVYNATKDLKMAAAAQPIEPIEPIEPAPAESVNS